MLGRASGALSEDVEERADWAERGIGLRGKGMEEKGWVLGFGFLSFLFLSPFSNKLKQYSNIIEFKPNLNSNPMHSTK